MDVSVIVSWFIDVSTHKALGYMWRHHFINCFTCGFLVQYKKKVLLLMNNSKRCRMKSAFVHHQSYQCNTTNLSIPIRSWRVCYCIIVLWEETFCLHLNLHSLFCYCWNLQKLIVNKFGMYSLIFPLHESAVGVSISCVWLAHKTNLKFHS